VHLISAHGVRLLAILPDVAAILPEESSLRVNREPGPAIS
jgi:hypothetical protein